MRVSIYTHLPLFEYGAVMGLNPWELAQVGQGFGDGLNPQCAHVFYQYQWQKDFISREELALSIADAEAMIANELGYWPAPHYMVDEVIQYPRPHQSWRFGSGVTPRGDWKPVETRWHKVIGGGVFNRTSIGTKPVAFTDEDGDGVTETFQVQTVTTVTDPDEIAIYFKSADRNSEPVDETWRIRPVHVTISGGTATITGHTSQLVLPDLTTVINPQNLSIAEAGNFAQEVEVYRVFRDTTATSSTPYQGVAIWDEIPDCDADCTFSIKELCIAPRNNAQGRVAVNYGTPSSWPECREPDRLQVNYLSGVPLVNGRMDGEMARIVARLATALLPADKCGCERSNRILNYWRIRPSDGEGQNQKRSLIVEEVRDCPWEPRQGALYAWKRIRYLRQWGAVGV